MYKAKSRDNASEDHRDNVKEEKRLKMNRKRSKLTTAEKDEINELRRMDWALMSNEKRMKYCRRSVSSMQTCSRRKDLYMYVSLRKGLQEYVNLTH